MMHDAYIYCADVTRKHYENFPVASLFLPKEKRRHISAIYAFARAADDFADEGTMPNDERLEMLSMWQSNLENCYEGIADNPVFIALGQTVRELQIPKYLFIDLLTAFRQDVVKRRYESFDELLDYCKNSANPVGRLVLLIFGYNNDVLFRYSDYICTALQLTNFWQDIDVDRKKNRIYIPFEDLERFDYSENDLFARRVSEDFCKMMQMQVERTRALFREGFPLTQCVKRDLRLELSLTWFGGYRILDKIEKVDYDVFTHRPKLGVWDIISLLVKTIRVSAPFKKQRILYVN